MDEREKYQRYLCSREWAEKRDAVRKRCGGTCERCKHFPMDHVHHLTYIRKYNERPEDLQAICLGCHEFTHNKRDRDPRLDVPAKLLGREIRTVYLAGKISRDNWRDQILPGWSVAGNGSPLYGRDTDSPWPTSPGLVPLPDGRAIDFAGPYWIDLVAGGHASGDGPHRCGETQVAHGQFWMETDADWVSRCVRWSIFHSDLVFAWIPTRECFGTLVEIGYAAGLSNFRASVLSKYPRLVVACPSHDRELWLAGGMADAVIVAPNPAKAWERLWSDHPLSSGPSCVQDDPVDDSPEDRGDMQCEGCNRKYFDDDRTMRHGMLCCPYCDWMIESDSDPVQEEADA